MNVIDWIKKFFERNPTLRVSDLGAFEEKVAQIRDEFMRLKEDVKALNSESLYVRRLVEAERIEADFPEDQKELVKQYSARREAHFRNGQMVEMDGLKIVQDALGRNIVKATGETVGAYRKRLRTEFKSEMSALRRRRGKAFDQVDKLREGLTRV